jgi:glutamyl-Q tRNA(Asp) synthetase
MPPPVFRFAPSPNGYLHLGHALSALLNADMARAGGGRLLLRIEDIDAARCRPEYEVAIYEDLAWLGLTFEQPVRRQSEHYDDYRAALGRLDAQALIYPSFESRGEIAALVAERDAQGPMLQGNWPRDPDGVPLYPGAAKSIAAAERARRMQAGEPYALRLDMTAALSFLTSPLAGEVARPTGPAKGRPDDKLRESEGERVGGKQQTQNQFSDTPLPNPPPQGGREQKTAARAFNLTWAETGAGPAGETGTITADPTAWGDAILARKDAPASYHLAVVVDDASQGITDVVRGRDLFHSTSIHRLLQALLGLPQPRYHHHRLILDADGRKLSKSTLATGLRELRAQGLGPADIRRLVGLD